MALSTARRVPVATYRVQLRKEFPFAALESLLPYLASLGISDCYCSPLFMSAPGSSHGYDVNDYRRINPELGGRAGLERLHATLRAHRMGLLLDFVPNHMGINGPGLLNTWWRDVLANGRRSPHARFFDIDWSSEAGAPAQVLVPILDDHYGRVLEAGRLAIVSDGGALGVAFGDMRFPLSAETQDEIVASAGGGERLDGYLRGLNGVPGQPASFDALDALLARQHYRLAYWKAGAHETNYRRFFAIDSLIGLRMENLEVFQACHALLGRLLDEGVVTGVRIDHVDGLRDPAEYLERLQALAGAAEKPLYVVVEKILAEHESLPPGWAAHGTTGYEFIAQLAGVLVDTSAAAQSTAAAAEFCGETTDFDDVVYEKKRLVLEELFANTVERLAGELTEIARADRRWRDLTRHELAMAVRETMAAHSVYRTYRRPGGNMDARDRRVVEQACAVARGRNPRMAAEPFEFTRAALTGDYPPDGASAVQCENTEAWALDFQQYTGAVMAKAVEDTAFYTFNRFVALNEVGGNPGRFGGAVAAFHAANAERAETMPHALLATATHDTKWGEDARARLHALSELPHDWRVWTAEWRAVNRRHKTMIDGREAPDANEEYRLYQTLLATWPADAAAPDEAFRARLRKHERKAVNEAKRNTTWAQPNERWLEAGDRFIDAILDAESGREFLASFRPQAERLAHLGAMNSLAQLVLKIVSPGVPDFYQGSELWDLSLVDPDNRREVDFTRRQAIAAQVTDVAPAELLRDWRSGAIKLAVTRRLLQFRAEQARLFQEGGYQPMKAQGRFADNVLAFARTRGDATVIAIVPRLASRLGCPPLGLVWENTALAPEPAGGWRDVLTGRNFPGERELRLADVFSELPVAVLERGVSRPNRMACPSR